MGLDSLFNDRSQLANKINVLSALQVNVLDYGAKSDGTDNITAFTNLSNYVNGLPKLLTAPVEVVFPSGQYTYSGGLAFTRPVKLVARNGAILNYIGTGIAIKLGADGITVNTYDKGLYSVKGIILTGGSQMTNGIYFNSFVTNSNLDGVIFYNFGNPNAWGVYYQADNWDASMYQCKYFNFDSSVAGRPWVCVNGYHSDGTTDYGNSRLRVFECLGTPQAGSQVGFYLNGIHNEIAHCKLEGFAPNVRIGGWGSYSRIHNTYTEAYGNASIEYGSPTGRPSDELAKWPLYITVEDCYCNVHNTDSLNSSSYFVAPTAGNTTVGLQNCRFERNDILSSNRELIKQNNVSGQTGNVGHGNSGYTQLHTAGSNISPWNGGVFQGAGLFSNMQDESMYSIHRAGLSAKQWVGHQWQDYLYNVMGQLDFSPTNYGTFQNNGNTVWQADPSGNFKVFHGLGLSNQINNNSASNGWIFEDNVDGVLKYKNLAGVLRPLAPYQQTTAIALQSSWQLTTSQYTSLIVNPASAVTGIILQAGTFGGQKINIINKSAYTVTFAASNSNVADGSSDVINAGTAREFVWDAIDSLWYRLQ